MSDTVSIRITATENASGVFAKVGKSAETAGQSIQRAGQTGKQGLDAIGASAEKIGARLQTVGATLAGFGAALTLALGAAASKGIAFEAAMANVSTISGETGSALAQTSQQVRDLGVALGQSPTGMAKGLYEIQSSGFAGAEGMEVLQKATVAAGAGLTTMATSGKAITAVLNAYGQGADKAGDVSDVLFKTVESGVVTFEQLANNLGSVLPIASTLNVGIEELGAAFAELTLQGINVSQAETGIANLMRSALNPTTAMTAAIQEYGAASAEALIQSEGLAGFLNFLTEASGGTSAGLSDLLGNAEATTAALALMRNEGQNFTSTLAEMNDAAQGGALTQGVFETQAETTAFALQRLSAEFENAQIAATAAITPLISFGADALGGLVSAFTSLPGPIQATVGAMGALAGVGASMGGAFLLALPTLTKMVGTLRAVTAASLAFAVTPMGLAVIGITAAVGIGTAAFLAHRDSVREAEEEYKELIASAKELSAAIGDLRLTNIADAQWASSFSRDLTQFVDEIGSMSADDRLAWLRGDIEGLDEFWRNIAESQNTGSNVIDREDFLNSILPTKEDEKRFNTAFQDLLSLEGVISDTAFDQLQATIDHNFEALGRGSITIDEFINGIEYMGRENQRTATMFDGLTDAQVRNKVATDALVAAQQTALTLTDSSLIPSFEGTTEAVDTATDSLTSYWNAYNNLPPSSQDPVASDWALNYAENLARLEDATQDFLSNGDHILDFWLKFTEGAEQTGAAIVESQEQLDAWNAAMQEKADFRSLVESAEGLYDAGVALDSILNTFSQIDAIGQRSASANSIADALIGPPGELGALQDLWARISDGTSDAALSQEQYNAALTAGVSIQESNLRVQDDLNVIRAAQIPLLAQQQVAYEQNIAAIARMTDAQAQQQAIALQDAQFRQQVAEQFATAYAASLNEIPKSVATNLIVSAAEADPVLAGVLEQMDLIEVDREGNITVNFPDGPTVQESIVALTESIDALVLAITGIPVAHVDIEDNATPKIGDILANLGEVDTVATATVDLDDNATAPLDNISIDLGNIGLTTASPTVSLIDNASDPLGNIAGLLGGLPEEVEVPVIPVWQGSPELGDGTGGASPFDPITIPATADVTDVTITSLPNTGDGLTVPITGDVVGVDTSGLDGLGIDATVPVTAQVAEVDTSALDGLAQDVTITVTQVGMESVIGLAHATTNAVNAIPTAHSTAVTESGSAGVIGLAHAATNAINAIPTSHHTSITMSGAEAAIGNAHAVANAINAIPGSRTSTITTNIVTAYSTIGSPTASALGGIPELAVGGITARMGELGPEQLYFAAGGTASVFQDRTYVVPPMTYVSPAHANPQLRGGGDTYVTVQVAGSLVHERELIGNVTREIAIGIRDDLLRHYTAAGVNS